MIPIFQRQRNVLNLTYWHAVLLTHRPFLLGSFAKRSQQDDNARAEDPQTRESIEQCIKAAMTIANTIDDISQKRQMFRAFWVRGSLFLRVALTSVTDYCLLRLHGEHRPLPICHTKKIFTAGSPQSILLSSCEMSSTYFGHRGTRLSC